MMFRQLAENGVPALGKSMRGKYKGDPLFHSRPANDAAVVELGRSDAGRINRTGNMDSREAHQEKAKGSHFTPAFLAASGSIFFKASPTASRTLSFVSQSAFSSAGTAVLASVP